MQITEKDMLITANCQTIFQQIKCPHCHKSNFWKNGGYREGFEINCANCTQNFQQVRCPNCNKSNYWKNADYREGYAYDCANCQKKFQHIKCPHCNKSNFWKDADYRDGYPYDCANCHKKFQHLNCPNCNKANYWKNTDYKMGSKTLCGSCKGAFQHINCTSCFKPNFWKNANYMIGLPFECSTCKKVVNLNDKVTEVAKVKVAKSNDQIKENMISPKSMTTNSAELTNAKNGSINNGDNLCDVCFANPKNSAFVPCGHVSCCEDCCKKIANERKKCIICNAVVTSTLKLFVT